MSGGRRAYKRALVAALPHEFKPYKKVHQKRTKPQNYSDLASDDYLYDFDHHKAYRTRSLSDTNLVDVWIEKLNINERFGKGMWENSKNDSSNGLMTPLKIIKLPARSRVVSVEI